MKLKMKLEQIIENKKENTQSTTFLFKPTLDDYHKHLSFKVSCSDPYDMLGKLQLPQSIGDVVVLEMIKKEEQTSLDKGKDAEKD